MTSAETENCGFLGSEFKIIHLCPNVDSKSVFHLVYHLVGWMGLEQSGHANQLLNYCFV